MLLQEKKTKELEELEATLAEFGIEGGGGGGDAKPSTAVRVRWLACPHRVTSWRLLCCLTHNVVMRI